MFNLDKISIILKSIQLDLLKVKKYKETANIQCFYILTWGQNKGRKIKNTSFELKKINVKPI